ncbi:ABC transporter substrate-binding protein [Georgenia sp. AZ-5]|uniref:ABC transporter substrate-binding protein n=1 Tax=Georgenia sp. AZ-5 TaxID=3367526 RepID=UPI0037540360
MRTKTCVLSAGLLLAVAACSTPGNGGTADGQDDGGEAPGGGGGGTTEITVGVLPIVPTAALQLGIEQGFFEERGLDVTLETGQGGAALVPAVVAGELQFATSNPLSIMVGQSTGLPVEVVSGYAHAKPEGDDITGVFAMPDSGIASPADLAGRTVGVNTLGGQGDVTIREVVRQAGGDPDSIQFVELPFPDMPAALSGGRIDAAWVPEPFQTVVQDNGAQLVTWNYQEAAPGLQTLVMVTSSQYAQQEPDVVEDFVAAVEESTTYAQENPDEVRAILPEFLEMDPALAERVLIEDFDAQLDPEPLQRLADLAEEDGLLEQPVDLEEFLPQQ